MSETDSQATSSAGPDSELIDTPTTKAAAIIELEQIVTAHTKDLNDIKAIFFNMKNCYTLYINAGPTIAQDPQESRPMLIQTYFNNTKAKYKAVQGPLKRDRIIPLVNRAKDNKLRGAVFTLSGQFNSFRKEVVKFRKDCPEIWNWKIGD
jgi:hypothetical protein